MVRLKFLLIYYILTSLVISSHWFVSGDNPPAMVLPDETIHGTRRHHFEVHDLADVAGGKWKAVHIPDEDISSMLEIANEKNKTKYTSDIEHEDPSENIDELGVVKLPAEVHGRVHPFAVHASSNKSKNSSRPVGKLIVAMENGERGIEAPPHPVVPKEIELRGYMKEEKPKSRQLHPAKILPRPSLVVAKIPDEDDDSDDDLPLEKVPDPIVAPLRKTSLRTKAGAMRSKILATVIPSSGTSSPKPVTTAAEVAMKTGISTKASDKDISNKNPEILAKIKSLLLKSHHLSTNAPVKLTSAGKSESKPLTLTPEKETAQTHQNVNGLFPLKPNIGPDAFSNHANALNRITSTRKEALLVGIIRALLAQNKLKSGNPNEMSTNILPHYNRQAVLQGIQSLQMKKTFANSQNDAAPARVDTGDPASTQNLDELYKNQRDEELRQELARANEESAEARKMGQQESLTLSNYDRFLNPESRTNWGNMSPGQSQTGDGQVISTLGPQQLNMVQDNATT